MKPAMQILSRTIVATFYRQHAGLFLFGFFLLFGIQPGWQAIVQFHYGIIQSILTSTEFFWVTMFTWFLYAAKCLFFFRSCLQKEAYDFMYRLLGLSFPSQLVLLLSITSQLLGPVSVYALIVMSIGFREHHRMAAVAVLGAIILLHALITAACYYYLGRAKDIQTQTGGWLNLLRIPPGLFLFLTRFIFGRQFMTLAILKAFSFTCLFFLSRAGSEWFEARMLWNIYITILLGHSIIIYRCFHFMEGELSMIRNMPVRPIKIWLGILGAYALLLIPEYWALIGLITQQHNWPDYAWMVLTGPFLMLLVHCLLYSEDLNMQGFMQLVFGLWVVFVFFSLSSWHFLLPLIAGVFSLIIFSITYYGYERKAEIEKLE